MNASKLETLLLIVKFKCTLFITVQKYINILPRIKINSVSLILVPSDVICISTIYCDGSIVLNRVGLFNDFLRFDYHLLNIYFYICIFDIN